MCVKPIFAWYNSSVNPSGKRSLHFKPTELDLNRSLYGDLSLPCGRCIGCLTDRRNNWTNRMMYESAASGYKGSFITLTYSDEYVPDSLQKSAVQKFIKRLRNVKRDFGIPLPRFKYFFCGERGSQFGRPHYHGLLFGVDMLSPQWKPYLATFKDGYPVYSSKVLDSLWSYGFTVVGGVDYASIRYVSKYVVKPQEQPDSFTLKSQGLGVGFFFDSEMDGRSLKRSFKAHTREAISRGILHFPAPNGNFRSVPIPKCYDRYLEKLDADFLEELKAKRLEFVLSSSPPDIRQRTAYYVEINKLKPNERMLH